jgi:hypothetical protein
MFLVSMQTADNCTMDARDSVPGRLSITFLAPHTASRAGGPSLGHRGLEAADAKRYQSDAWLAGCVGNTAVREREGNERCDVVQEVGRGLYLSLVQSYNT